MDTLIIAFCALVYLAIGVAAWCLVRINRREP